MTLGNMKLKML